MANNVKFDREGNMARDYSSISLDSENNQCLHC